VATHGAAAVLSDAPRRLYAREAAQQGGWLVIADTPPELDGRHGDPFSGDAGRLRGEASFVTGHSLIISGGLTAC